MERIKFHNIDGIMRKKSERRWRGGSKWGKEAEQKEE